MKQRVKTPSRKNMTPCHGVDSVIIELECKTSCRIINNLIEIITDMSDWLQTYTHREMSVHFYSHSIYLCCMTLTSDTSGWVADPPRKPTTLQWHLRPCPQWVSGWVVDPPGKPGNHIAVSYSWQYYTNIDCLRWQWENVLHSGAQYCTSHIVQGQNLLSKPSYFCREKLWRLPPQ